MFHDDNFSDFTRKSCEHLFTAEKVANELCKKGMAASRKKAKRQKTAIDYPVDFVVTWVDSTDSEWLSEKEEYYSQLTSGEKNNNSSCRYRNWDLFRYWLRAVEKYAPWVRYVWLITYGHTPIWLNLDHPKLRIIKHEDFIPHEYLPTFNSVVIELNMWRISELSEHFVYFNDDFFLFNDVRKEDFFTGNLPNLCAVAKPLQAYDRMTTYEHSILNVIGLFNSTFKIRKVMYEAPEKWFSYRYGTYNTINRITYTLGHLCGIYYHHLTIPMRKSSMEECHAAFCQSIHDTCLHRFRSMTDINNQIFFFWEMLHNTFEPVSYDHYGYFVNCCKDNLAEIRKVFAGFKSVKTICLNDNEQLLDEDFEYVKDAIVRLMDKRLPDPSAFEKV